MTSYSKRYRVEPGAQVALKRRDARATSGVKDKQEALGLLARNNERLEALAYNLYAEDRRALLVVLQGMDTAGKDGTIRHVMRGVNPQSCRVTPFKAPSDEELDHDFLWRIHQAVPGRGEIGIFNRSHYEDVLIVRVHNLVPRKVWSRRYRQINRFERNLAENDVTILKFFLHISRDEQKERLQARLDDSRKNWKFNPGDLEERKLWKNYMAAYEDALSKCSTKAAPWFIVPADRKWFRNLVVSSIIVETLEAMDPRTPPPEHDLAGVVVD
jgi:PPK2 family polyphosphate:nucleotide phosphotransferase